MTPTLPLSLYGGKFLLAHTQYLSELLFSGRFTYPRSGGRRDNFPPSAMQSFSPKTGSEHSLSTSSSSSGLGAMDFDSAEGQKRYDQLVQSLAKLKAPQKRRFNLWPKSGKLGFKKYTITPPSRKYRNL